MLLWHRQFLWSFAVLQKATISAAMTFCPCVSLSVLNNSAPTGKMFMKFVVGLLEYMPKKFNTVTLHEDYIGESGERLKLFWKFDIVNELKGKIDYTKSEIWNGTSS
jgi:hypothetical protein